MLQKRTMAALALSAALSCASAAETEWPHAADIPAIEPVTVGLAGEKPADIVRYLMARGALQVGIAPDGRTVAYTDRVTGEPQLWLVDASGGWPRQLTFGTTIRSFRWSPTGTHLLVTRDTEGDEREGYFLLSADGTRENLILPLSDTFRMFGMFSSDGSRILYSSTERNGLDFDIYVADVGTGRSRMVYQGTFGFVPRSWQPDGDLVIVEEVRGEAAVDVHLLDMARGTMTPLFRPSEPAYHGDYAWLPDGSGFFLATNNGREFAALAFYSLDDDSLEFLEAPDADVGNVALTADGRYLAWTTNEDGYARIHVRDRADGAMIDVPELPAGVYGIEFADAAPALAIRVTAPAVPGDVYVWNVADGTLARPVRSTLAGLDPATFVAPESVHYDARDGVGLQGFLYLPPDDTFAFKPPLVVNVHGGPTGQSRPTFDPQIQYLVNNGIAVFDVNVRGSTGYGKTFTTLDDREKRLDSVRDLADTVAYLATDDRLNTNRAAVMGGSYGGYMVNAVLGSYPGVFDAGASFAGVSDWVRALEEASPMLRASDRVEYGDITEERWQAFYRVNSPINNAHRINVPMFVEHGANDPRDPVTESDRIVETIRGNGGEVTYLRFPDEGHGIAKQVNRVAFNRALVAFLERHLVPDPDQP